MGKSPVKKVCARKKSCTKGFACVLLGECVYGHEMVKDNAEAQFVLRSTKSLRQTCLVFHNISKGKPLKLPYGKEIKPKEKEHPISPLIKTLDLVTVRMYNDRMKRIAELDSQFGYIYDERDRGNFHEIE